MTAPWRPAPAELRKVYLRACRRYYPDWPHPRRWQLREGWPSEEARLAGLDGSCDRDRHTLYVAPSPDGRHGEPLGLAVLIHEVGHAIAGPEHGIEFRVCLLEALRRAEARGEDELAGLLDRDLRNCEKAAWTEGERRVYEVMEDVVRGLGVSVTYVDVVEELVRRFPEHAVTPQELEARCPSLRRVYRRELERLVEQLAPEAWTRGSWPGAGPEM